MLVARRACADPRREITRDRAAVQAGSLVAEIGRDGTPARTVPRAGSRDRVRDLVQKHLVNLVVLVSASQVTRYGDALCRVVAEAGSCLRVVEPEAPAGIEVQRDEGVRPGANTIEISHALRLVEVFANRGG